MTSPKTLQRIRTAAALIMTVLCITGFLGMFYPVKIFSINIVPLIQQTVSGFTLFSGVFLALLFLLTLGFGRIYCSTVCPLGLLQEFYLLVFHRKKLPPQKSRPLKYFIAALSFGVLIGGSAFLIRYIDPYSVSGSAVSGATYGISFIAVLALLTGLKGRFFCTNVCPVGAVLGLISRFSLYKIRINPDNCVACGLCAQKCPAGCIDVKNKKVSNETCLKCFRCLTACRKQGITFTRFPHKKTPVAFNLSRRKFIIGIAVAATFAVACRKGVNIGKALTKKLKQVLLPAGAGSADRFAQKCLNCNLCVENCPMKIIRKANADFPVVHLDYKTGNTKSFCNFNCRKCSSVCPSGALKHLSLKEKQHTQIGLATVNTDSCIQCGLCALECPRKAIVKPDGEFPAVNTEKCIGCGACQAVCPVSAIRINPVANQKLLTN